MKEEEEEDTEVDEIIAWFIFACVFLFFGERVSLWQSKTFFQKKNLDEIFTRPSSKSVKDASVFLTQEEQTSLQKSGALKCDDENDE